MPATGQHAREFIEHIRNSRVSFDGPIASSRSLLDSTPQLLARDRRAVAQGAQLGPGGLWMDAAAYAAVGLGDDVSCQVSDLPNFIGEG